MVIDDLDGRLKLRVVVCVCVCVCEGGGRNKVVVCDSATQYCCSAAPVAPRGINSRMGRDEEKTQTIMRHSNRNYQTQNGKTEMFCQFTKAKNGGHANSSNFQCVSSPLYEYNT